MSKRGNLIPFHLAIILYCLAFIFSPVTIALEKKAPHITARSAAIVRTSDGVMLYGKSPFLKLPPASTAKVMTVLIALKDFNPAKEVFISSNAANIEPTRAGLREGDRFAMRDLIKAALISSANDAAVAIAEEIAGSEEEFVILMNKKAKELGMRDTVFANATGLPDKKDFYTTAYDLTVLMREAAEDSLFVKIANIKEAVITQGNGRKIYLRNHNKMLWRKPGVIGKTGYTETARHCFVGLDTSQDTPVAFAILCSRKPWDDTKNILIYSRYFGK